MIARNVLITDSSYEPVTDQQLVDDLREDAENIPKIKPYAKAARRAIEQELISVSTTQKTYELRFDTWYGATDADGWIILPACPLVSITSVKYDDANDAEQTLAASNYQADTASMPGRIRYTGSATLPAVYDKPNAIRIRYVAGYGAAGATDGGQSAVPEDLKVAVLLKTRLLKEPGAFPQSEQQIEQTIQRLISTYRTPV